MHELRPLMAPPAKHAWPLLCSMLIGAYAQSCSFNDAELIDLTITTRAGIPVWDSAQGLQTDWRSREQSMDEGPSAMAPAALLVCAGGCQQ